MAMSLEYMVDEIFLGRSLCTSAEAREQNTQQDGVTIRIKISNKVH